ncbi:MAG: adenylosuccinate lyase [candidate division NC10 bacterium]|nr:adenylosuccinate lyase [candidate division NC10 bacterium]
MIPRYTLPRMAAIWELEHRFQVWLRIEVLACEAWAQLGKIPPQALQEIRGRAAFDIGRIEELEETVRHEVVAFLTTVAERVGEPSRYIHLGMTSSDVMDTALAFQLQEAAAILLEDLDALLGTLKTLARTHKHTVMVGRTHGVHAEPMTFGLKVARWYSEMLRNRGRLEQAKEAVGYGKLSGAVGTYAHLPPSIEMYVCEKLGLKPEPVSSQVIPRDRHAQFLVTLATVGSGLENIATEIRQLQRTEVFEVAEPFTEGQKGSSSMPHKRNPVICEQISGLCRILRVNAIAGLENVPLWHERDISHSSVERVILPDSTILLDYLLTKMQEVLEGLQVYPEQMARNVERTEGLLFSQRVLLALAEKGVSREGAHDLVQRSAMRAWEEGEHFQTLLVKDPEVLRYLAGDEVAACFDLKPYLEHVDTIFTRLGL